MAAIAMLYFCVIGIQIVILKPAIIQMLILYYILILTFESISFKHDNLHRQIKWLLILMPWENCEHIASLFFVGKLF